MEMTPPKRGGRDPAGGILRGDYDDIVSSERAWRVPQVFGHTPSRDGSLAHARGLTLINVDVGMCKVHGGHTAYTTSGPFAELIGTRLREATRARWNTRAACERFHSGAYLLETVPCVLFILAQHGDDPEEAIVRAVNDTKDNDTTAAIVGAAVGMLHGAQALPSRWRAGLSGRTTGDDDGRMFELIAAAKVRFWAEPERPDS